MQMKDVGHGKNKAGKTEQTIRCMEGGSTPPTSPHNKY